jgi:hypothetical protein
MVVTLLEWHLFPINDHLIQDMRSSLARTLTITSLFAMSLACSEKPTGPTQIVPPPPPYVPPPRVLAFMKFAPDTLTIMRGDSGSVSLVGNFLDRGQFVDSPVGIDEATLTVQDSTVARIDTVRRMVTAVGAGKTVISAKDKRGVATQMTVTVRAPYYVRIRPGAACAALTLEHEQYTAELYDSQLVRMPDEPVVWSSSDTSVVTMDATGLSHMKKAGTAMIIGTMHGERGLSSLIVDPAPLGTAMTCGGIFTSKSDTSSFRAR